LLQVLSAAWNTWIGYAAYRKGFNSQAAKAMKMLTDKAARTAYEAFATWRHNVLQQKTLKTAGRRVMARLRFRWHLAGVLLLFIVH
jgi:hypothetical protein